MLDLTDPRTFGIVYVVTTVTLIAVVLLGITYIQLKRQERMLVKRRMEALSRGKRRQIH